MMSHRNIFLQPRGYCLLPTATFPSVQSLSASLTPVLAVRATPSLYMRETGSLSDLIMGYSVMSLLNKPSSVQSYYQTPPINFPRSVQPFMDATSSHLLVLI